MVTDLWNTLGQLEPSIEKDKQMGYLYRINPIVMRDMSTAGSVVIALEAVWRFKFWSSIFWLISKI